MVKYGQILVNMFPYIYPYLDIFTYLWSCDLILPYFTVFAHTLMCCHVRKAYFTVWTNTVKYGSSHKHTWVIWPNKGKYGQIKANMAKKEGHSQYYLIETLTGIWWYSCGCALSTHRMLVFGIVWTKCNLTCVWSTFWICLRKSVDLSRPMAFLFISAVFSWSAPGEVLWHIAGQFLGFKALDLFRFFYPTSSSPWAFIKWQYLTILCLFQSYPYTNPINVFQFT